MTQREEDNSYAISCDYVYIWKATKNKIMSYYLKYNFFKNKKKMTKNSKDRNWLLKESDWSV